MIFRLPASVVINIVVLVTIVSVIQIPSKVNSYNILSIFPFSGKSHFHMFRTVSDALVARGHNVTVVGHFPLTKREQQPLNSNQGTYIDYSLVGTVPIYENITTDELMGNSLFEEFLLILQDGLDNCEGIMSSGRINELMRSEFKFDLIIVEIFNTGCFVSVANHFGAPIVGITSTTFYPWYAGTFGDVFIPSYIPVNLLPFTGQMTFVERVINTVTLITMKIYYKYKYEPKAQQIVDKYLGKLNGSVSESVDNVHTVIINTHFTFGDARPLPPGIIEIGGCTYKKPKPLPKDLEQYVSSASRGVLYFSMGSIVKGSSIPIQTSLAILRAFGRLNGYKVLLKWEDDLPPQKDRPDNLMFLPWLPQFDVLNHPNVKLFISHGGLMGTLDALYSGVPIIGIPLFADQFSNMNFIVQNECGLQLNLDKIDEQVFYETITAILDNDKYAINAKKLSQLYRDRNKDPLEMAVYWIEYVAKYWDALPLKLPSTQLQWYEQFSLDVVVAVITTVYLAKRILTASCKMIATVVRQ